MTDTIWNQARAQLTEKQYEAVHMRYQLELPIATIAAHLGISRQAVNQRISNALDRLATRKDEAAA